MSRRTPAATLLTALILVLTACAGLPTNGTVNPGLAVDEQVTPPNFSFIADPPQPGASPREIIDGFLAAGSGTRNDWGTAREYLTESFGDEWKPAAGVTVELPGERTYVEVSEAGISVTLTAQATVDADGSYDATAAGALTLPFRLTQEAGQWRISEAPDGIVLDEDRFEVVFRSYPLMYFDPTWTFLVPDVRWFTTTNPATRIAGALIDGSPAPWLSGAVANAVSEDVTLAAPSVPVRNGVAQVELASSALGLDPATLDRLLTQLEASMAAAGIGAVVLTVDGQPLPASAVSVRSTSVPQRALGLTADGFGFLSADALSPIEGLSGVVAGAVPAPAAVQLGPDHDEAALLLQDGVVARARADGDLLVVDERPGLLPPSIDLGGWIWSVPGDDPRALWAVGPEGAQVVVEDAWPDAVQISAMQLSRDGTRLAAALGDGSGWSLWVAGVERDGEGAPVRLGEPRFLRTLPSIGLDVEWLDGDDVGVIVRPGADSALVEQSVGGAGTIVTAPAGITALAGTNQPAAVRLLDADGVLYVRRGTNWGIAASGIRVLAGVQGNPR